MPASLKAYDLTPEMEAIAIEKATAYGVSPLLSDHDQLLGFFINNARIPPEEAVRQYFDGGRGDAHAVLQAVHETGSCGGGKAILEFAAGFGRVTRHLAGLLPENRLYASDIHESACDLIRDAIGTPVAVSSTLPEELRIEDGQDLVVVLSLFSHLPDHSFGRWLAALYGLLTPGGALLFTTHGDAAMAKHPDYFGKDFDPAKGFGYRPESDQQDLASSDYGTAVVTLSYVDAQVRRHAPDARIESFRSSRWFGLQDEWVVRKPSAAAAEAAG